MSDRITVVGGGTAGMTAALAVASAGGDVTLVASAIGGGSSPWAQGGIAAAVGEDDSPSLHLADTFDCGGGLVDRRATTVLVNEASARLADLISAGVPFDRVDGNLALGLEGGHHRRRIVHAGGGATGWHVVQSLAARVRENPKIKLLEGHSVQEIVVGPFGVVGCRLAARVGQVGETHPAIAAPGDAGSPIGTPSAPVFVGGPVVLATGGCAGLYGRSTNPPTVDGAGISLAWHAGAALADLEFVQFHPTALDLHVPGQEGRALLLTEALRGEGARLYDSRSRRFLAEGPMAHPLAELAPRDYVARAIYRSLKDGPVTLSLRHLDPAYIRGRFPNLVELLRPLGLDLATDPLPVAPAAHYLMGGVLSSTDGATTVPGLFVAGEIACTGVQGANRLASNSLLECLVFGRRAGLAALRRADGGYPENEFDLAVDALPEIDAASALPRSDVNGIPRTSLGRLLDSDLGVERDRSGIVHALKAIPDSGHGVVARRIAVGAWLREESRGAHFRRDFPVVEPRWQGRIVQQLRRPVRFLAVDDGEATTAPAAGRFGVKK